MKKKILSLIILCSSTAVFADDLQEIKQIERSVKSSFYPYLKVGAVPLVPNIGFGFRGRNVEKRIGHDLSINANIVVLPYVFPSLKYTALFYRDKTRTSSYFGIGFEGGIFDFDRGIIPNIELVWGQDRESVRFSQFGINVLPTVVFLSTLIDDPLMSARWTSALLTVSGLCITSYTVAF